MCLSLCHVLLTTSVPSVPDTWGGLYHFYVHHTSTEDRTDGPTQETPPTRSATLGAHHPHHEPCSTRKGGPVATAVARKLDSIRESGGIKAREIAQLLETTPQTVSRWQTGRSTPRPNSLDRLLRLEWLAGQLAQVYPPGDARVWLFSPPRTPDPQEGRFPPRASPINGSPPADASRPRLARRTRPVRRRPPARRGRRRWASASPESCRGTRPRA